MIAGSYGGDYSTFKEWALPDGTQHIEQTLHRGLISKLDESLESGQRWIDQALVGNVQEAGAQAYANGNRLAAWWAASSYLPNKVLSDTLQGALAIPRLYTSNTLLPGVLNMAANPLQSAQGALSAFNNMTLQDKVVAGVELLGPAALKATSYAGRIPGAGRFLTGELGYNSNTGVTITASGLRYGFTGEGVSSAGRFGSQRGAVGGVSFGNAEGRAASTLWSETPGVLTGRRTAISPADDAATARSLTRENDSADILVRNGFNVEQNPSVSGAMNPDYRINGEIFDNIAPSTDSARNIWGYAKLKVDRGQAPNIVINLADSGASVDGLVGQFGRWKIPDLQRVIFIDKNGTVSVHLHYKVGE